MPLEANSCQKQKHFILKQQLLFWSKMCMYFLLSPSILNSFGFSIQNRWKIEENVPPRIFCYTANLYSWTTSLLQLKSCRVQLVIGQNYFLYFPTTRLQLHYSKKLQQQSLLDVIPFFYLQLNDLQLTNPIYTSSFACKNTNFIV